MRDLDCDRMDGSALLLNDTVNFKTGTITEPASC